MQLHVNKVTKALSGKPVLNGVSFTLEQGQTACLLGASGCGKTTLLRCIAGFESVNSGSVKLDGEVVASAQRHTAPHDRASGMVFQDHALFPHLSVAQNAAFGLHRWAAAEAKTRVESVLELVGLSAHAERFPHELSGGQQQRAALARAMATRPRLLLLDEPFASLDRDLRYRLVQDVSEILKVSGTTALWVTHDAREALQAADFVGVMRNGTIEQWDTPVNLYQRPVSLDVAMALGDCSMVAGTLLTDSLVATPLGNINVACADTLKKGDDVQVLVRPEQLAFCPEPSDSNAHARVSNALTHSPVAATLKQVWFHGQSTLCLVSLDDGTEVNVSLAVAPDVAVGEAVRVAWSVSEAVAFLP